MAQITCIDREGKEHRFDGETGLSLMENLKDNDMEVEAVCGGCCACATCHVFVDRAWLERLTPPDEEEVDLVQDAPGYDKQTSRLSCQIEYSDALDGLRVTLAPEE